MTGRGHLARMRARVRVLVAEAVEAYRAAARETELPDQRATSHASDHVEKDDAVEKDLRVEPHSGTTNA